MDTLTGREISSGRYLHFAEQLTACGFGVYAMDWIGHGASDGLHGYVPSLDYVIEDIEVLLDKVMMENPGIPCFLLGHSTGGAVVLKVRSYEIEQYFSTEFRPGLDTDPASLGL